MQMTQRRQVKKSQKTIGPSLSLAEAKARLSEVMAHVESGNVLQVTRRGRPVATISPVLAPRKPFDLATLRALTDSMEKSPVDAGTFVRQMRDEDRY